MTIRKAVLLKAFLIISLILLSKNSFAIGELAIGANMGITYDPNNLESEINQYNKVMMVYKENNQGTKVSQIRAPYCFSWGLNLRYQYNFLLFRLGCHFSKATSTYKGNITPLASLKNTIKISTFQNSIPVSIGFIVPLKKRTYFYIGSGLTYHLACVEISQSNPDQTSSTFSSSGLSTNRRDKYIEGFSGFHLLVGAEAPINELITISVEWMHQEGRSAPIENEGTDSTLNETSTPKKIVNARGDFILFGFNYYINI